MGSASSSPKQVQPASESFLPEQVQPTSKSPSPEQTQPTPRSSSPEQKQLMFVPSSSDSKSIDFIDPKLIRDLIGTGKSIGSSLDAPLLKALASETNPDRATSRFITDAIGNNDDICLWLNAKLSLEDHTIPKGLSIHLFTKTIAKKILSHEVHSMIIQVSESSDPSDSYPNILKFLKFLFSKVSLANLKCLMLYGIRFSRGFSQWLRKLNLKVFHMGKFSYDTDLASREFFHYCDTLKRLYVVHPDDDQLVVPPNNLEKLVIYCPESRKGITNGTKARPDGLVIRPKEGHCLGEM
jgi:hypothetical protein